MKTRTVVFAAVALSIFGAFAGTLRIMPVGDSITYGQGWDPHGGYRAVLREKLVAAGYDVDYVGNETRNQGTLSQSGDVQHEGHPGWRVDQVTKMFPTWSSQIDGPNIILLKIGTNNCNSDHATVIGQIGELLDTIKRVQPSAHVIVSTLVPFLNGSEVGSNNVWVEEHNALLKMAIAQRVAAGDLVSLVDIYPVVSPTTGMNDDRHPNEEGYRAMAQAWFDAIAAVCPDPATAGGNVALTATKAELDSASGNVTVWFNQAIDAASATAACFQCGTLEWASVDVAGDARSATLTPAVAPKAGTTHEVSVSGVTAGSKTVVAHTFSLSCLPPGARNYVPEAGQYRKVYEYAIPTVGGALNTNGATYNLDEHGLVGKFTRIAYYVELVDANGILQYLWVSMDAFTNDVSKIGVPTLPSGAFFQQYVYNMHVYSNVSTITPGEKEVGNIEFWPYNYFGTAKLGIPGATGGYDVDDSCNMNGNFACMQIHDTAALVPLFCYNNWGGNANGTCDLGLGPNTSGNLDWTQNGGGNSWPGGRKLEVYVLEDVDDETVPALLSATLSESRRAIDVVFDYPIAEEPDFSALVSLSGGVEVKSARRDPSDARILHVSCSFVAKPSATTLSVVGLHAGSPRHTPVPAFALQLDGTDYESGFPSAPQGVVDKVPAAADYAYLYKIDIPGNMAMTTGSGAGMTVDAEKYAQYHVVDNSEALADMRFSRVGYLLELEDKSGNVTWAWTAFDAYSQDFADFDIPTPGHINGRFVSNLDVASNVGGIVEGKGLATGVIEFSPYNFAGGNVRGVPNATGDFDFGDQLHDTVGNYSVMSVANYAAELPNRTGQIVWELSKFTGYGGQIGIGIGNSADSGNIDYTRISNGNTYKTRTLYILVKPDYDADESTDYEPVRAVASSDLRRVAVSFQSAVGELAAQPRYYTVAGATIAKAEVSSIDSRDVILTLASPLSSNSTYTVETQFPKSTNKSMSFNTVRGLPSALVEGVEEIGGYTLLNDLTVPQNSYIAANGADYRTDESRFGLGRRVERIAYALELQYNEANGGEYRWAWVSMDPFTEDPAMMGVPSVTRGNHFQCYVDNISVRAGSSAGPAPIATGEWSKGNIEFTPSSYSPENEKNIPGATGAFDFGDRLYGNGSSAGHGCMQIHNYLEEDMILGFSRLGGGQVPGLLVGLLRNQDGSVSDDGTWTANANKMTTRELRVFVKLAAEEPVVGDKGVGPEFLVQPSSVKVKTGSRLPPQTVALNAYAPGAVRYQWRKNGAEIPGATGPVLDVVVSRVGSDEYTVIAFADDENYTFSRPATVSGIPIAFVIKIR